MQACFLIQDTWDDFGFKTLFHLVYFDASGSRIEIGAVKVMKKGMGKGRVVVAETFSFLDSDYCSVGQNQEYYETLLQIAEGDRIEIMEALRDVVWNASVYADFAEEYAFNTSLLRGLSDRSITKFRDVVTDKARANPYEFTYVFPSGQELLFRVVPDLRPPTNIHVVIGRNGVGKTRLLHSISALLRNASSVGSGELLDRLSPPSADGDRRGPRFANLIDVAFSVFDEFIPPKEEDIPSGIAYRYIGLRSQPDERGDAKLMTLDECTSEFVISTLKCVRSSRRGYWRAAMEALESDPIFAEMEVTQIDVEDFAQRLWNIFSSASSGHKTVLLTMTKLVELVSERTLVLIDEPEAHLHPPLAASFIRALSALLATRNGLAILATHSTVMLQEVPQDCVWLLFRTGATIEVERPQIETFAETLGVLTREVFRLAAC